MTVSLPNYDGTNAQYIFDKIASILVDTGGRSLKIRFGSGTVTWAGGTSFSGANTVSHGLGSTPVAVFLQDAGALVGLAHIPVWVVTTLTATTFQATAETSDASNPAAATQHSFYWFAIG